MNIPQHVDIYWYEYLIQVRHIYFNDIKIWRGNKQGLPKLTFIGRGPSQDAPLALILWYTEKKIP